MAVELTNTKATFAGTGVLSNYTPGIYANSSDQIKVYVDDVLKTIGDDYVLNDLSASTGVSISANFALGAVVRVERVTPITQRVDTQNNETILQDVLDGEFDKLTMIAQELAAGIAALQSGIVHVTTGAPLIGLFVDIGMVTIPAPIVAVLSSGFSTLGVATAAYVSDAAATAGLAAAHPLACKQSADGRYWRLKDEAGVISAAQLGATGSGLNEQAALQAACDYALATRIGQVGLPHAAYAARASTFVPGGFGGINATGAMININGALAPAPASLRLFSMFGKTTITRLGYATGGDPNLDAEAQQVSGSPRRGGGINVYGTQADAGAAYADQNLWAIQRFEMDGIIIEGNTGAGWGGAGPTSTDTSDKGVFTFNAVREIVLKNGAVHGFYHELLYGGGIGYGTASDIKDVRFICDNFEASGSNHSALNMQDTYISARNCRFGNAYIAAEQYGLDGDFTACTFFYAQQFNTSASDRGHLPGGGTYDVPSYGSKLRSARYKNCTFDRVDAIYIGPNTFGDATVIDGVPQWFNYANSIDLDLTVIMDQKNHMVPLICTGQSALPGGALTDYKIRNIRIGLSCQITARAQAAGHDMVGMQISGFFDPETCLIDVKHYPSDTSQPLMGNSGTVKALPRVVVSGHVNTPAAYLMVVPGQSGPGGLASPTALDPWHLGYTFYPNQVDHVVTLNDLNIADCEGYAHGQEFWLACHATGGASTYTTKISDAANVKLASSPLSLKHGDRLLLVWDKQLSKWRESRRMILP